MTDHGDTLDITLSNGNHVSADVLIEGIGVVPEVPLVSSPALESGNGISVDQRYATAHPCIFAIGDVACVSGQRQETWAHAESSARAAARSVMSLPPEALPVPSFWSDQFSRIQIAGDATRAKAAGFHGRAHLYHKDGIIVAVAAIGAPRDFAAARRLIGRPLER
jgi:3-phenylpropionate/trans-cinnamate dioxygenase ferredoxin reductase subunit